MNGCYLSHHGRGEGKEVWEQGDPLVPANTGLDSDGEFCAANCCTVGRNGPHKDIAPDSQRSTCTVLLSCHSRPTAGLPHRLSFSSWCSCPRLSQLPLRRALCCKEQTLKSDTILVPPEPHFLQSSGFVGIIPVPPDI